MVHQTTAIYNDDNDDKLSNNSSNNSISGDQGATGSDTVGREATSRSDVDPWQAVDVKVVSPQQSHTQRLVKIQQSTCLRSRTSAYFVIRAAAISATTTPRSCAANEMELEVVTCSSRLQWKHSELSTFRQPRFLAVLVDELQTFQVKFEKAEFFASGCPC